MKKLVASFFLLSILFFATCSAESKIYHKLWGIDIANMSIDQVHDSLESKKGVLTSVIYNYDKEGHSSLNPVESQKLTLYGFPCAIRYIEVPTYSYFAISFDYFHDPDDVFTILQNFVKKYGEPTCTYYDMYSRSSFEWDKNIGDPMYHKRSIVHDWKSFSVVDTLNQWEHLNPTQYLWGQIIYKFWIDNIEIEVSHSYSGYCSVYVRFYSRFPSGNVIEVDEQKNIDSYVDTGL